MARKLQAEQNAKNESVVAKQVLQKNNRVVNVEARGET
jgi:hypothetical protein